MSNLNIYVGYDSKEDIAYRVCKHSIFKRSGANVKIRSLKLYELIANKLYNRSVDPLASTEFTYSRFLVPVLNKFAGWAIFCDCDFIFFEDVSKILKREMNMDQAGDELIKTTIRVASGRLTCAEVLGHKEFIMTKLFRSA